MKAPQGPSGRRSPLAASEAGTSVFTSAAKAACTQTFHPCHLAIFRRAYRQVHSSTSGNQTPAGPVCSGCWAGFIMDRPSRRVDGYFADCPRPGAPASSLTAKPVRVYQDGGAQPPSLPGTLGGTWRRPPARLIVVDQLPGVSAGVDPRRLVPGSSNTPWISSNGRSDTATAFQTRPLSLVRSNPKPFASYVVVVVLYYI